MPRPRAAIWRRGVAAVASAPAASRRREWEARGSAGTERVLVVGLGNPGSRYAATRHNLGFEVGGGARPALEMPRAKERFRGLITEGRAGPAGPRVAVLVPQTYMNESGELRRPCPRRP